MNGCSVALSLLIRPVCGPGRGLSTHRQLTRNRAAQFLARPPDPGPPSRSPNLRYVTPPWLSSCFALHKNPSVAACASARPHPSLKSATTDYPSHDRKGSSMSAPTIETVQSWQGRTMVDPAGDKLGTIDAIYLDDETGQPEWAMVTSGLFGTKAAFVPLAQAQDIGDSVKVPYDKQQVKNAPAMQA